MGARSQWVRTAISDLDRSALGAVGIDQDSIRLDPPATNGKAEETLPFNRAAKAGLESALHQAVTMKHRSICPSILAALTATGSEDRAHRILVGLGNDVACYAGKL